VPACALAVGCVAWHDTFEVWCQTAACSNRDARHSCRAQELEATHLPTIKHHALLRASRAQMPNCERTALLPTTSAPAALFTGTGENRFTAAQPVLDANAGLSSGSACGKASKAKS
jgi:hypothetical protein